MKKRLTSIAAMLVSFASFLPGGLLAQDSLALKIIAPFDSLQITECKVTGDPLTGVVTLQIPFLNQYARPTEVYFGLGGFEEFGITDDKGRQYKIHTNENLIRTAGINKGFARIASVEFGDQRMSRYTYIQRDLKKDETQMFRARISNVSKDARYLKEIHIRCRLTLNHMLAGEKVYRIENARIEWIDSKKK